MRAARGLLLIALVVAIVLVADAHAHLPGAFKWRTDVATAMREKNYGVLSAHCQPVPEQFRARYGVRSRTVGTRTFWDHFRCGVLTKRSTTCQALVHVLGTGRYAFTTGSWPHATEAAGWIDGRGPGCSSADLRTP